MNSSAPQSIEVTPRQIAELRQICERLAYLGGGSLPPQLNTMPDLITTLSLLTEICSKRMSRRNGAHENHELQDVERLKARFIRNVSHELRTPLACIDGFARALLQMDKSNGVQQSQRSDQELSAETRHQFLSIISQEAQRLGKMVEDVLDLTDIESNRRRRMPETFTARLLIDEALQSMAAVNNVTVRLKPEDTGPTIYADREMMIEVLRELISNALKFSGNQPIVIGAEQVSIGPNRVTQASESGMQQRVSTATQLYVKDTGVGIAPDDLDRIFEKFYRSELTSAEYKGTGLGLSIARALVAQNNGQIWVDSEVGHGSTFYVLLPNHPPGE
ncbi:MAG TPA: HAMP domain-containing sensor histidine kinase [Planctomycetota bacterium]|nr:HAMP domain-containing sensor histidine kinase [Planctomycetota bacterium]